MMDLQKLVSSKMQEMVDSGAIEKMVEDQLNTCIKSVLDDAMRSYGDFGKQIKEKVKDSLENSLDSVSFPEYNAVMANAAKEVYENFLNGEISGALTEVFKAELKPVKDEISFSELNEEVMDYWGEYGNNIDVDWELRDGNKAIEMIIKHPEYDWKNIKVTLYDHDNEGSHKIGYIETESKSSKSAASATYLFTGLEGWLFKCYSNRTKFTDLIENADEGFWKEY